MYQPPSTPRPPPRLLLGSAFLFWGGMSGHPLVALAAALLVEGPRWTRLRWDFTDNAFVHAWHLTVAMVLFGVVSVWLDGPSTNRIYDLFNWLPVLMLPIQFVQAYGTRSSIPLYVFTIAARSRIERERRLGRMLEMPEVNFGNVLLTAILLGSALGRQADAWLFAPGALALLGWALRDARGGRSPIGPWLGALAAVALLGGAGLLGIHAAHAWLLGRGIGGGDDASSFHSTQLELGGLGDHKNSPRILWRLRDIQGQAPQLLRTASFNIYHGGLWHFRPQPNAEDFPELGFTSTPDGVPYRITGDHAIADPAPPGLPRFALRGPARRNTLLPLPRGVRSLREVQADDLEANFLGTVRIVPVHPLADTVVTWDDTRDLDAPPWIGDEASPDLRVPSDEAEAVRKAAAEIGLQHGNLHEKIITLQAFFLRYFHYARHLDTPRPVPGSPDNPAAGAIGRFLTDQRQGHCEFFATATTLLLRHAGVPARYTIGFAAIETNPDHSQVTIRGTHAHAWCRAWDAQAGRWIDVDLTPPDWTSIEPAGVGPLQQLLDRWQRLREDVLAWRTRPGNLDRVTTGLAIAGALAAAWVVLRLWQSRRREAGAATAGRRDRDRLPAPLRRLAAVAGRRLGPRPVGQPLGAWLGRLDHPGPPGPDLGELIDVHARLRFDPAGPHAGDDARLAALATALVARLRQR